MRNVRMRIAYDGSEFYGWQRQDGFESVQGAIEDGLEALLAERIAIHGSGRTDTGVHALGQVASFHVDTRLDDRQLLRALNAHLGESVSVLALETCPDDFHAQKSATGKRYLYTVATTPFRPCIARNMTHWVPVALDLDAMQRAANELVGEHDFTSFACAGSVRRSNVRRVTRVRLVRRRERFAIVVQGNGFLYNMVRVIAGTLIEVGKGKRSPESMRELLAARDRRLAGPTAPASGLCLLRVLYAGEVFGVRRSP